jgi:hypothetical protein
MHPVQKHLFDTNFKDLAGSHLEGTIALSDELINLGIMDFLSGLKSSADTTASKKLSKAPAAAPTAMPDPKQLLAILDVETLKFRSAEGRIFVDVAAGIK